MIRRLLVAAICAVMLSACTAPVSETPKTEPLTLLVVEGTHAQLIDLVANWRVMQEDVQVIIEPMDTPADIERANERVASGEVHMSFVQSAANLKQWNKTQPVSPNHGPDVMPMDTVHIVPLAVFSARHTSLTQLAPGATVVIPAGTEQQARALLFMQNLGVINLDSSRKDRDVPTVDDVAEHDLDLKITVDAFPQDWLGDESVDLVIVDAQTSQAAGFSSLTQALAREHAEDNPYASVLTARYPDDPRVNNVRKLLSGEQFNQRATEQMGEVVSMVHA